MPIHDSLVRIARGEVLDDEWSRLTYSVDSSHYQVMPEAVVFPADAADVQEVCKSCHSEGLSVAARGAGTGLLGQSLSRGIVLDLTKHMNRIIDIDTDQVITQPGVVKRFLDLELKKRGKFLPPDPASSNYCTIGGMIANNSSGIHCLGYGHTIDFLDGVRLVYTDGSEGNADGAGWDDRMAKLRELLVPEKSALTNDFPRVTKNSCGYRLDAVMSKGQFLPHKVLAASEGTLGIVTEARFRILDLPEHRALLVLGFEDLLDAMKAVPQLLQFRPAALEMMDHTVVAGGKPVSDKGCILFVEFAGDSGSTQRRLELCIHRIGGLCSILECASDEQSFTRIWGARKGALNNIMKMTVGSRKPIGLIEDTVVRPELLGRHVEDLICDYREHGLDYVMYGHAGDGNVHTRPIVNLDSHEELRMMEEIAQRVFMRVTQNGGTITGEHGDGLGRLPYIGMVYGKEILDMFRRVKELFDPKMMLNPGKKVPAPKLQ